MNKYTFITSEHSICCGVILALVYYEMRSVHVTSGLLACKVVNCTTYIQFPDVSALTFFAGSRAISNKQFEGLLLSLPMALVCLFFSPHYMWAFQRVEAFGREKEI